MITRILLGLGIIVLGYFMVWKAMWFYGLIGSVPWAERTFGSGGSQLFYKLLGIVIILIGAMVMTNLFEIIVGGFVASIFAI